MGLQPCVHPSEENLLSYRSILVLLISDDEPGPQNYTLEGSFQNLHEKNNQNNYRKERNGSSVTNKSIWGKIKRGNCESYRLVPVWVHVWKAVTLRFLHGVASALKSQKSNTSKTGTVVLFEPTQINMRATKSGGCLPLQVVSEWTIKSVSAVCGSHSRKHQHSQP